MVIGRFPIPSPSRREYARIFGVQPEDVKMQYAEAESDTDDGTPPRMMAIFELLDHIVNKVSKLKSEKFFEFYYTHFFSEPTPSTLQNLLGQFRRVCQSVPGQECFGACRSSCPNARTILQAVRCTRRRWRLCGVDSADYQRLQLILSCSAY